MVKSTRTDAEFATQMFKRVKAELPPELKPDTRAIPVASKKVKAQCVVCDHEFEGPLDSTGRLRCPSCNSTFTPR